MPPHTQPQISNGDIDSIYYIHPSEGPNSVKLAPLLTGPNYLSWSRSMQRALGAKNKLAFIDGSITVPDSTDLNSAAWERCNYLIHSWILNSVSEPIAQTIVFLENALDVWVDLKERFTKADRIRVANILTKLNNLKQESKSVLDYYTEMRGLWEELNSHIPLPACTCIQQCKCEVMRSAINFRIEDQIIQFLTGLNDSFSVIKTQVLLMESLPSINKIYSMVIQEENNHVALLPKPDINLKMDEPDTLINAYDSRKSQNRDKNPSSSGYKKDLRICTHYNRTGHTIKVCYRKHGFPPHFGKVSQQTLTHLMVMMSSKHLLLVMKDQQMHRPNLLRNNILS